MKKGRYYKIQSGHYAGKVGLITRMIDEDHVEIMIDLDGPGDLPAVPVKVPKKWVVPLRIINTLLGWLLPWFIQKVRKSN